ncbi:hypothetical protein NUU61_001314 [Penicillium alfredii]|uniref:Uncharacterized protein n=1 Tax=Penicillium alfredii TaxID=1506179 RepID=A0A9W9G3X0_9EURO|nr:uncharacterized protein NUU61_001314 [Penicillium alfredii]KAJ5111684.1 hypothetical protein NUU61_001314 [Penicillium alfredii]
MTNDKRCVTARPIAAGSFKRPSDLNCIEPAPTLPNNCIDMQMCDHVVAARRSDDEFTQSLKIWSSYLGAVVEVAKMLKADAENQDFDQGTS